MKIGVITNYDKSNYGSVLQAYALQNILRQWGHSPYIVYKKNAVKKSLAARLKNKFFNSSKKYSAKDRYEIRKAQKAFELKRRKLSQFLDKNVEARACSNTYEAGLLVGDRDILIVGSDQVWSATAHQLSEFTTLQFGPERIKRCSYAASLGMDSLDDTSRKTLKEGLETFSQVSVRESSAVPLIESVYEGKTECVLDPTFLYNCDFWNEIAEAPHRKAPYIFVYMLRPEPLTLTLAKQIAKEEGCRICLFSNRIIEDPLIDNITDVGIEQFLGYIKNASYVVTNSFHGTAFAVQFHKQFLSVAIEGSGMRVTDFLTGIHLESRIAFSEEMADSIKNSVDWDMVDEQLEQQRKSSLGFLKQIVTVEKSENKDQTALPVLFRDESECSACGACRNSCPQSAITMEYTREGFLFPQIDKDRCIRCGVCKRVCNYQKEYPKNRPLHTYGAVAREELIRMTSASGGAFAAIAEVFINQGGVVYGCSFEKINDRLTPAHIRVTSSKELKKLQSSKYAQSDVGMIYRDIKADLEQGKKVVFSGTPCQLDGLKGYLNLNHYIYDSLYTIDLVCHGVPGIPIFQEYIDMLEREKKIKIDEINFRDKKYGWGEKGSVSGGEKYIFVDSYSSSFYHLYLKSGFNRENCFSCHYANIHRVGDITIGDFWGVEQEHPQWMTSHGGTWENNQGVSCILANSDKGMELLDLYGTGLDMRETSLESVAAHNKMLLRPARPNGSRKKILELFAEGGYEAVDRWFWKNNRTRLLIYGTWDKIPPDTRKKIKKVVISKIKKGV